MRNPNATECAHGGCCETFASHQWGKKAAQRDGWFLSRNGPAWCPKHIPEWVTGWRERKAAKGAGS